jgi:hypothetical protein
LSEPELLRFWKARERETFFVLMLVHTLSRAILTSAVAGHLVTMMNLDHDFAWIDFAERVVVANMTVGV